MLAFLIRFVILLLAGYGLFRLSRASRSSEPWMNNVIAIGFLGRAIVGQIIFWISYARLPIVRGLQLGDGLWFFAADAMQYFSTATHLAETGVRAIIDYPTGGASVAFVKVLSAAVLLLGPVTSVAVLLNLFCYLGTIAVIVGWSEGERRTSLAASAICAISLSPSFFLWSLQPLKDTFFQFVVIAFIGACAAWQRTWRSPKVRMQLALMIAAAMTVTLLAISGVRWYFAFALFIATIVFLLLVASRSPASKTVAFTAFAVMSVILSRAFLLGGGPYVPPSIIRILTSSTAIAEVRYLPSQLIMGIQVARDSFDKAGGRTSIHPGGSTSKLDRAFGEPAVAKEPHPVKTFAAAQPQPSKHDASTPDVLATKPAPTTVRPATPQRKETEQRADSIPTRLLTGVASVVMPRSIGERLGLFRIGGGQGMFWFTELDTIVFDFIAVFAVFALGARRFLSLRNPLVWFLILLTVLAGLPLSYAITNYGTLYRLREMIYIGLALTPLAVATSWRRDEAAGAPDESPAS